MELRHILLPWLLSAMLVLSGAFARGAVLCVTPDGQARIEQGDLGGNCVNDEIGSFDSQSLVQSVIMSPHTHCDSCDDLSFGNSSIRLPSTHFDSADQRALRIVHVVVLPRLDLVSETPSKYRESYTFADMSFLPTETETLRETVTLLI